MTENVNSYAQILNGPSQLNSIKTYNDLAASLSEYNNEVKAQKASVQAEKKKADAEKAANKVRRDQQAKEQQQCCSLFVKNTQPNVLHIAYH